MRLNRCEGLGDIEQERPCNGTFDSRYPGTIRVQARPVNSTPAFLVFMQLARLHYVYYYFGEFTMNTLPCRPNRTFVIYTHSYPPWSDCRPVPEYRTNDPYEHPVCTIVTLQWDYVNTK